MCDSLDTLDLIDPELSLLAFQRRVLALAEDSRTPLLERLRFLGIVTSNLDELYMVRMVELRAAALDATDASDPAITRLREVEREIESILAAQARCAEVCLREAAQVGVGLLSWRDLSHEARVALRDRYLADIQPDLISHAITLSTGHPIPHLPHLGLFLAVVFRASPEDRPRLVEHELPRDVPRLLAVPDRAGAVIAIEEVLRVHAPLLYPGVIIEGAYLVRVTRGGELPLSDQADLGLLDAVERATAERPHNPAVRVEVERSTPAHVGALILENLRREAIGRDMALTVDAVQVVDGLLDLRCLQSLPLPSDNHASPSPFVYPPLVARTIERDGRTLLERIRQDDLLLHHPFDDFDDSVVRFFEEAAVDPQVQAIDVTLYRVGNPSPIVEALAVAARAGKRVFALVELQARFDEVHNVHWARTLERAGGHVRYGINGLKVHAKVAVVSRREDDRVVRYVHVGSGNYNPRSGRQYTDVSLFSARPALGDDMAALFAALSAGVVPTGITDSGALLAPQRLLPGLLGRIEREAEHARAGRPAHITIKVNALADTEVVRTLVRASQAGVRIDLIVRGICTLRPEVAGISTGIRVLSVVGRFLEHSRLYRFANGGAPEYFLGSADLRPRNLRRRIEILVPVPGAVQRAQVDELLARYLSDGTAWDLQSDGGYLQGQGSAGGAQTAFVRELSGPAAGGLSTFDAAAVLKRG